MTGYVRNPMQTFTPQTPIGNMMVQGINMAFARQQAMQQQAMQQQEMAMKQAEFDAKMPLIQAQTANANADAQKNRMAADETAANMASIQARPDTIASAFANLTIPQLGQVRGFQKEGNWGAAPTVAGLDNLGSGGNWMPTFANPETMQKVNHADMMTGMMSGPQKSDDIAKAITQMMLNSQLGSGDMQGLNAASAALKGQLRGDPNANGLYQNQDVGGGVVGLDMGNPLVADEVNRGKAYSAHQYAGARQADAAAALNNANIGKVNAQAENERTGGGAKGALTEAQRMENGRKNEKILTARKKLKALVDSGAQNAEGVYKFNEQMNGANKGFTETVAMAQERLSGVEDPQQAEWVKYLAGQGYKAGSSGQAQPAAQRPAAQPAQAKQPAVGEVRKGYRFRGGNPADKGSWEYVGGA
jgi:hypothetical protein